MLMVGWNERPVMSKSTCLDVDYDSIEHSLAGGFHLRDKRDFASLIDTGSLI